MRRWWADYLNVTGFGRTLEQQWNWRLSAHCRLGTLASAWMLLFLVPMAGWLLLPFMGVRTGLSLLQSFLNIRLGRRFPVGTSTRLDWGLMFSVFAGAYIGVGAGRLSGDMQSPLLFLPMLLPFSVLQVRMAVRSYSANRRARVATTAIVRLLPFARAEAAA